MRLSAFCGQAHFVVLEKNFQIFSLNVWHIPAPFVEGLRKGKSSPAFAVAKGGDTMNEPNRTQWQIRCALTGFASGR